MRCRGERQRRQREDGKIFRRKRKEREKEERENDADNNNYYNLYPKLIIPYFFEGNHE